MGNPNKRAPREQEQKQRERKPEEQVRQQWPPPPEADETEIPGDGFPEDLPPANRLGPSH